MPTNDYSSVKNELEANEGSMPMLRLMRAWTRICWSVFLIIMALSAFLIHCKVQKPILYPNSSLLGGTAGLAILAIVVALSAYLRSVAGEADKRREKIRDGKVDLYPMQASDEKDGRAACTDKKLGALDSTCWKLQVGAGFLIILTFVVAARLFIESLLNLSGWSSSTFQYYLRIGDSLILLWFTLAILGLAIMHWIARDRDERIRTKAEECRERHDCRALVDATPPSG